MEYGREHHRVTFEQPKLFGVKMTVKVWGSITVIGLAMTGVGMAVHPLLMAGGATVAFIGLALGLFNWLIQGAWKKGPRVVKVCGRGLVIVRADQTTFVPWGDITGHRVVNTLGGMPQFLLVQTAETKHQLVVQSLKPAVVRELAGHIESFTSAE